MRLLPSATLTTLSKFSQAPHAMTAALQHQALHCFRDPHCHSAPQALAQTRLGSDATSHGTSKKAGGIGGLLEK